MKTKLFFIGIVALLGVATTSCDDKKENLEDMKYSSNTIEENKQEIEEEGIEAIQKLDGMKELSSVYAVEDLVNLLFQEGNEDNVYNDIAHLLTPIAGLNKNVKSLVTIRSIDSSMVTFINQGYNNICGIYTYDPSEKRFKYEKDSTQIAILFPIGESETNNGKLIIDNYTYQVATNPDFAGKEQIQTLDIKLLEDSETLFCFNLDVAYNNDDIPSDETTDFYFKEGYSFSQTMTNRETNLKWVFAFAKDDENIVNGEFNSTGNFSYENLDTLIKNKGGQDTLELTGQVLNTANAFIQAGNLKMAGVVNFDQLVKDYHQKFPEQGPKDTIQSDIDQVCDIMNDNIHMVLMFADKKEAIAKSLFYTSEHNDKYRYWGVKTNTPHYNPDVKFVLKDGSSISESFFHTGFGDFKEAFEDFQKEMKESYGNE